MFETSKVACSRPTCLSSLLSVLLPIDLFPKIDALNRFVLIAATLILSLLLYKVSGYLSELISESASVSFFGISESYRYAFPIQLGSLLITYLAGVHLALFTVLINSILFGYMFHSEFLIIYALVGGLAAILGVRVLGQPTQHGTAGQLPGHRLHPHALPRWQVPLLDQP